MSAGWGQVVMPPDRVPEGWETFAQAATWRKAASWGVEAYSLSVSFADLEFVFMFL